MLDVWCLVVAVAQMVQAAGPGLGDFFNGLLKTHHFRSGEDLRATLHRYVALSIINCRKLRFAAPRFRP